MHIQQFTCGHLLHSLLSVKCSVQTSISDNLWSFDRKQWISPSLAVFGSFKMTQNGSNLYKTDLRLEVCICIYNYDFTKIYELKAWWQYKMTTIRQNLSNASKVSGYFLPKGKWNFLMQKSRTCSLPWVAIMLSWLVINRSVRYQYCL
jgi:hypothetical protein